MTFLKDQERLLIVWKRTSIVRERRDSMGIQTLTTFFMWCTILTGSLFVLSTMILILVPDWVYRIQSRWFPIPRETYTVVIYSYIGLLKIVFLVFTVVPYIALLIIG